jgi:hypothetical protein
MDRHQKVEIEARAKALGVPAEGLSVVALASALRIDPSDARAVARVLHRKRIVWLSSRAGHERVYAKRPAGRGRPPASSIPSTRLIDPVLERLAIETFPIAFRMKLIERQGVDAGWERRAEIAHDLAVEAERITKLCRQYVGQGCPPETVRETLWLAHPEIMPIAADVQPDLAKGERPFAEIATERKRMPSNLSDDERVLRYIDEAGPNGIAAYEVVKMFRGGITRERVEQIGEQFENMEMIHSAVVRPVGRGKRALRYFAAKHGLPSIEEFGGRFVLRD